MIVISCKGMDGALLDRAHMVECQWFATIVGLGVRDGICLARGKNTWIPDKRKQRQVSPYRYLVYQ